MRHGEVEPGMGSPWTPGLVRGGGHVGSKHGMDEVGIKR